MAAFIREYVQLTQESAFNTPVTTPVRGTNQIAIRLPGPNQQTMRANPVVQSVPYGGGFNVIRDSVSDKTELKGTLTTPLFYSQAEFLFGWALKRMSGGTLPWTSTEPAGQFASCSLDHAIMYDDTANFVIKRYTGCKVDGFKITLSEESQYAMLAIDIIGGVYQGNTYDASTDPDVTDAPIPVDDDFPSDFVQFIHSAEGFTLGAGLRSQYTSLNFSAAHQSDVRYYANRFVQCIRSFGSMYSLDSDLTLIASPDDRASFQTLGPLACSVVLDNGVNTLTLDFKGNNRIKSIDENTPLAQIFGRKLSLENRWDSAASDYFGYTVA